MTRAFGLVLATVTFLAPVPSVAGAQQENRWREEATAQVDHAAQVIKNRGYTRVDLFDGSLDQDGHESLTLPLRTGRSYALIGVCDGDCGNLDLRLFGGNDVELETDVEDDDYPVIMFTPVRDGKYRLKIIMAKCSSSPCLYAIGLFSK